MTTINMRNTVSNFGIYYVSNFEDINWNHMGTYIAILVCSYAVEMLRLSI
jgi:hypothetical protein